VKGKAGAEGIKSVADISRKRGYKGEKRPVFFAIIPSEGEGSKITAGVQHFKNMRVGR